MRLGRKLALGAVSAVCALSLFGCAPKEEPAPASDEFVEPEPAPEFEAITEPFYALVVGTDNRAGTIEQRDGETAESPAFSDTIMLVRVDPTTYAISLVSVPRDTKIEYEGQAVKVNDAYYQGGIEGLVDAVEMLTGVRADYTLETDFVRFTQMVDAWSGLTANVPIDMQMKDIVSGESVSLSAGENELDGGEALVLARSRKQYATDMDACRQIQDRQLVQRAIDKVVADAGNAQAYVSALAAGTETNFDEKALLDLVERFAAHAGEITITSGTGPYVGDIDPQTELWMVPTDTATWAQIIEVMEAGGNPQTVVPLPQVSAA